MIPTQTHGGHRCTIHARACVAHFVRLSATSVHPEIGTVAGVLCSRKPMHECHRAVECGDFSRIGRTPSDQNP